MPRTKGAIKNTASMTEDEVKQLLKEFFEDEPSWDELLSATGKGIEEIGRMLRGRGRKKPRVWSIEELLALRSALLSHRKMIKYYIQHLQDEAKNAL